MRPHPRIRKAIKWGGTAFSCMTLVAFGLSSITTVNLMTGASINLTLWGGTIAIDTPHRLMWVPEKPGAYLSKAAPRVLWTPHASKNQFATITLIPLWTLFLATALPTALAWRLDTVATRRLKLGACPTCSYPRTGLAPSSPCPECGAAAPQA